MANITVDAVESSIVFQPSSLIEEIVQNVRTILVTRAGNVPLDREFGLDWGFVDLPLALAQAKVSTEIIQKIRKYEPRARVVSVTLVQTSTDLSEGRLIPRVVIGVEQT